jgi:hypothetical protein
MRLSSFVFFLVLAVMAFFVGTTLAQENITTPSTVSAVATSSPTFEQLLALDLQITDLQAKVDQLLAGGLSTKEQCGTYYTALRDLTTAKVRYYNLIAAIDPDKGCQSRVLAWQLQQKANALQGHLYAMAESRQPSVAHVGRLQMIQ